MSKITAEIAYNYVYYGIKSTKIKRKMCFSVLCVNILFSLIAIWLYPNIILICLISAILIISILTSCVYYNKWSIVSMLLLQATEFIVFSLIMDVIYYAMYQATSLFIWQDYLVAMILQVASIPIIVLFTVFHAKTFKEKKYSTVYKISGAIAGTAYAISAVVCKVFLTDISINVILSMISVVLNIIVYL